MKILLVSIPNHHFFQWAGQLKESGYDVYWFNVSDGGGFVQKISWVNQIINWKLRFQFPFRHRIKKGFPKAYSIIQKYNERKVSSVFEKHLIEIKPDIVHCFEMKLSGIPVLEVMERHKQIPLLYSSWGSDLYRNQDLGVSTKKLQQFLNRADYLITDCLRDATIAFKNGFSGKHLGVFPGNGGISIACSAVQDMLRRNLILIKGYEDQFGRALKIIEALENLELTVLKKYKIMVYSAESSVVHKMEHSDFFKQLDYEIFSRTTFLENQTLLEFMGQSVLHIASSISDGMPNALLEAMGMGAFPIQSNPGGVSGEVIKDGENGYLISDPMDVEEIARLITMALAKEELRKAAQKYNTAFVQENYNRVTLQPKIVQLYQDILT